MVVDNAAKRMTSLPPEGPEPHRFPLNVRKHAKRSVNKLRGWVLRQWLAHTEPRVLELVSGLGGSLEQLQQVIAAMIAREGVPATERTARSAMEHAVALTNRASASASIHVATVRALVEVDRDAALRF